jgi:ubiquinone biosynthesis protein
MGGVLTQLFEITALFDMRLRPELVLLQKTMVVTEGVARRLYPDHDIWAAADPVVRRYIMRELAPPARIKQLAEDALGAIEGLVRRAEAPAADVPATEPEEHGLSLRLTWFAIGAALAGLAFLAGQLLH